MEKKEEGGKELTTTNMDLINILPDELLCRVLSFLPTQDAVATSLISRRWRHLWKDLQVFDFCGRNEYCFDFIDGFQTNRRVLGFRKFRLRSSEFRKYVVTRWVDAAIVEPRSLQELDISLDKVRRFSLPPRVFTCTSLISLTLRGGGIHLPQTASVHFPFLKNLCLDTQQLCPIDQILSGCPVLETLDVILSKCDATKIRMPPLLKRLTLTAIDEIFLKIECLEIDTPYLEYLNIYLDPASFKILFSDLPNLTEACIGLNFYPDDHNASSVPKLLKALYRSKSLELNPFTCGRLFRAPTLDLPEFCCLIRLELNVPCFYASFVIALLRNCHMLQVLIIMNWELWGMADEHDPPEWISYTDDPTNVPSCVISHLKDFVFREYNDTEEERGIVAYILERGLVLETMTIHTMFMDQKKIHHTLEALKGLSWGSKTCQLKFEEFAFNFDQKDFEDSGR